MVYEYFRVEESEQFSFFRTPKALFTEKEFEGLSTDAKFLYGILLDRINLSKKNGWVDADDYVYIIYTVAELQEVLHMSHTTVTKLLRELDSVHGIGLIERYRQGCRLPGKEAIDLYENGVTDRFICQKVCDDNFLTQQGMDIGTFLEQFPDWIRYRYNSLKAQ